MKYYSTNKKAPIADLHKAVVKGLAEDRGLYMPEIIKKLPQDFFDHIEKLSFQEIVPWSYTRLQGCRCPFHGSPAPVLRSTGR